VTPLTRSLLRPVFGFCPACGRGKLFVGLFRTADECPECGVRNERFEGTWVLAAGVASMIGLAFGCFLTVWWYRTTGETIGPALPLASSAILIALSYRMAKALLFGLLHHVGLVTEDPDRDGNVLFLDVLKKRRDRKDPDRDAG